jgi:hypothetical protein
MAPQTKNSDFGLCRHFKVASNPRRNGLKSTDRVLYELNINLDDVLLVELYKFPNPVLYCHVQHHFCVNTGLSH